MTVGTSTGIPSSPGCGAVSWSSFDSSAAQAARGLAALAADERVGLVAQVDRPAEDFDPPLAKRPETGLLALRKALIMAPPAAPAN